MEEIVVWEENWLKAQTSHLPEFSLWPLLSLVTLADSKSLGSRAQNQPLGHRSYQVCAVLSEEKLGHLPS